MEDNHPKCVLLFGATGNVGQVLVRELLSKGVKVRMVVRDINRTEEIFDDILDKIDKIFLCGIKSTNRIMLEDAFFPHEDIVPDCVISLLAFNDVVYEYNKFVNDQLINNLEIIKFTQLSGIKRFIFISSFKVTDPEHFIAKIVTKKRPYALQFKNFVENALRFSNLDYVIIRPAKITKETEHHKVNIAQNDDNIGFVTATSLSSLICDTLDSNVKRTTFNCFTDSKFENQVNLVDKYEKLDTTISELKPDDIMGSSKIYFHDSKYLLFHNHFIKIRQYLFAAGIILFCQYRYLRFKYKKLLRK